MKKINWFLMLLLGTSVNLMGQVENNNPCELRKFASPIQVDSSDYFLIGTKLEYPTSDKYNFPTNFNGYPGQKYGWTSVCFYNTKTKSVETIFKKSPVLIHFISNVAVQYYYSFRDGYGPTSFILPNCIIFAVITDDYNKDGLLDDNDPLSLYACSKTGNDLTKITPDDMNVIDVKLAHDLKSLILIAQKDNNGDKKFKKDDESLFNVNLEQLINKIKPEEIIIK